MTPEGAVQQRLARLEAKLADAEEQLAEAKRGNWEVETSQALEISKLKKQLTLARTALEQITNTQEKSPDLNSYVIAREALAAMERE